MMINKKLSIIAGILIVIGFIGSLLTYRVIVPEPISEEQVISDQQQVSIIEIDTDNIGVNIHPAVDDTMKVILEGETSTNIKKSLDTEVNDSTLFISYKEKQLSWFNFDIFNVLNPLTLNVYLPEKQFDSLIASNNNGYISAKELKVNHLEVSSNNGRIELTDIDSQSTQVKSDNGKITLNHVEGNLEGETNNGSISLITKELDRNLHFKTSNGKITIETEKEPTDVQFNVIVNNGRVNILDQYQGSTTVGNGGNLIELTTNNGNITVKK